jgi:transaldolase
MKINPLKRTAQYGQSIWLDSISRAMISSGKLQRMIDENAVVGVTSNPTIFQQAIAGSDAYNAEIAELRAAGHADLAIYETLACGDIANACDVLLPLYARSGGVDGRVSIEVNPYLADDAAGTIDEAQRLWSRINRPNLMIKIPATAAGISAFEEVIAAGISVNVTLLFAVSRYEAVMEAYLRGLERRAAAGLPVDAIHSVASFFISRVDTLVDKQLSALKADGALQGKAAVANARMAYQAFRRVFSGPRWAALAALGANAQRPLWASTSTKNPAYPDTLYISELIGAPTVNTVPENALLAFADHGVVRGLTIEEDVAGAEALLAQIAELGIDMEHNTAVELVNAGVKAFQDSFDQLIGAIRSRG